MSVIALRPVAFLFVMATPFLAIGCGGSDGSKVHVKGDVTLDGKPVDAGSITFTAIDRSHAQAGGKIVHGRYSVDNVAPGKNKILVSGGMNDGAEGGQAVNEARGHKMSQIAQIYSKNPQKARKMQQEITQGEASISAKTPGNNQVQELSTDRNQTIDITLRTTTASKSQ
jgi:hypothetical protein